jgi:hypothetical protein
MDWSSSINNLSADTNRQYHYECIKLLTVWDAIKNLRS